jgi:TP901 family phage tail tape measure protein
MADIQSDIKVNIDTSSALASIKNLQRQISTFQSAMAKGSAANSAAAQNLQKDLLQNINATGRFAASMTNVKTTTESFTNSLEKNKFSMGEYFRFAGGATKTFGKFFKSEFETINKVARERVKDLQTQYIQLGRDANGAMRAMKVRPLTLDLEDLGTKTQMVAQRQQLFNQLLKQGSTNLLNWGKNTQWAGRQLMVGFTLPLAAFGAVASKTFMDLEKQAIRFKRVYGDAFSLPADADKAVKEMQELASEFTKYGVAIEKTMELAADAAQMGLTGAALSSQVREATRLAVLGEVEQQEALSATISVTNAFGVAAEDLAKKIDFLNAVENETVTSINDLTIAIPKAGPVVQQLGGDVEDLAFFLTAMKEGGINASEGANALKSGLASLINPTKVSSEFLQKLGINISGIVEANKGDVKRVVIDFAQALDTLDPLNRARAIEQLFGKFQFSRISTLFQNVIAEGNQAQRVLELANASTSELATLSERELGKVAESTTFKYEKAIQDFRMALAPVGEEFLKAITPIIEFGTSLIKQFNNMDAGVKGFVTNITLLFAGLGPVLLMTVGLLANGIANIIKGAGAISQLFQRLKGGPNGVAGEINYMTQEQMEALAVAASLDQVHSKLQQTFTSEAAAIEALTLAYQRAVSAQRAFGVPPTMTGPSRVAPAAFAAGTLSVPGPKGAGDVVPAMLSPGEAVIPAKQAEKYRGFIASMIEGRVPGFAKGVMLGMPRSAKSVSKNREVADAIYQEFLKSSYANVPPTEYGHQIAPTSGHSFPIFGLGGVYSKAGGKQVFVKPVMDETAALAEIRGTQIARQAHGLEAPEQRIVVIRDPMDPQRQRRFLALESDLDAKFIQNEPKAVFNEEQYFRQLVASLVRVDKDLAAANVFGNVVADVGPAGVFNRASGIRSLTTDLPSMEEQALINLLGIKGGAKRAFAESTLGLMSKMTPQQYHQYMVAEIQRVLPALKQTVAGFGLSNPSEVEAYDAMIKRLEIGLGVDWSKFHTVHSGVKIATPKAPKAAPKAVPGYANGVVSVPGPKGKGDVVPAMLSPGEAVIPAGMAKKYAPLINGMIAGNIPGYARGLNSSQSSRFNMSGEAPMQASHFDWSAPGQLSDTITEVEQYLGDFGVTVYSVSEKMDDGFRELELRTQRLSELGGTGLDVAAGGQTYGATTLIEPRDRNQAYRVAGISGTPFTLEGVVAAGQRAEQMLESTSVEAQRYAEEFRGMVAEAAIARNQLASSNSTNARLDFMRENAVKALTQGYLENASTAGKFTSVEQARIAATEKISSVISRANSLLESGMDEESALQEAKKMLVAELLKAKNEYAVGPVGTGGGILRDVATGRASFNPDTSRGDPLRNMVPEGRKRQPSGGRGTAAIASATFIELEQKVGDTVLAMAKTTKSAVLNSIEEGLGISSPSREYENISNSVTAGVRSATDDAAAAGQEVGAVAVKSIQDTIATPGVFRVPGSRRATTNPTLAAMPVGTQTGGPRVPRRAFAPQQAAGGSDQTGLMTADGMMLQVGASAGRASVEVDKLGETAKKGGIGLLGYGGVVSNLTFGISALAGVMSSFGGEVGVFGQELFKVTGALFAATSVIQAFTQMKVLEIAKTRASIATQAAFGAAIGPKTAAQAATGFGATLARLGTFVVKLFTPMGLVVSALGLLGFSIFKIIEAQEKQRQIIESFGTTAFMSSEKLKTLGAIFDVDPRQANFAAMFKMPDMTNVEINATQAVLNAENFKTDFASEIEAVRAAAPGQEQALLESLQLRLETAGFGKEAVKAIVSAIAVEAGKTDIDLGFLDTAAFSEKGITDLEAKTRAAAERAKKAFEEGFTPSALPSVAQSVGGYSLGSQPQQSEFAQSRFNIEAPTAGPGKFTDEAKKEIELLAGEYSTFFENIKVGVENSLAPADVLKENLSAIMDGIKAIDPGMIELMIPTIAKNLGIEELFKEIPKVQDQLMLIEAITSGINIEPDVIARLQAASKEGANATAIAQANAARRELNALIEEGIELRIIENNVAAADDALEALKAELTSLQTNEQKRKDYIAAGLDAAAATRVLGDSMLSAAFDAALLAGKGDEAVVMMNKILKLRDRAANRGGSGGGAQEKDPFEDILTSLKNVAQRSVNVKGGIDEIFNLFGKNRNIKLDSGFESMFVKGNFSASFTKFLADAQAKTRDLLVSFKNGKAVLTDFGRAAQRAFQANTLAGFRLELRKSLNSMREQRIAIRALTSNNVGYAEAVKIASNAEAASAIATASNKKSKKELLGLLKLIRQEQKLQTILEAEQAAEDRKQSKIQEAKDLVEGIREQLREYNKFAKAQEQLKKSNFTLIEQQAILRDPVLITMLLDGLEPELLKAKLKEVINPEFIQTVFEEGFNNAMEAFSVKEAEIDIQFKIKIAADEDILQAASREIEDINFAIDDLEADLKRLEDQERKINESYDERIEALDKVKGANDAIAGQQKQQLTIADALSRGDISAAAAAAQELRSSQASKSIDMQKEALEKSREQELAALRSTNGKSRKQLEQEIKDLQNQIFEIEEKRLEPAQRRIDLATREKEDLASSLTVLGKTQLEWDAISSKINLAKIESDLYKDSIQDSLDLVEDLKTAWKNATPEQTVVPFTELPDPVIPSDPKSDPKVEDSKPKPKPKPKPPAPKVITPSSGTQSNAQEKANNAELAKQYRATISKNAEKIESLSKSIDSMEKGLPKLEADLKQANFNAKAARVGTVDKARATAAALQARFDSTTRSISSLRAERRTLGAENISLNSQLQNLKLNAGGFVSGPGTSTSDSIPAMLSDGEYVIKSDSVRKFGKNFLDTINAGTLPGFQLGGIANYAKGGMIKKYAQGGMIKKYGEGGFVMSKYGIDNPGINNLKAINNGAYSSDSVYNYSINVNVQTDANANDIARNVMTQIKRIDSQRIRGSRF